MRARRLRLVAVLASCIAALSAHAFADDAPAADSSTKSEAEPDAAPASESPKASDAEDVSSLQSELSTLMDELVQARTRAALLGKTLFKTVSRVYVQNLTGDDAVLSKVVLKLDGAPIFRGDSAALRGDDARQVFEGFIAPGPHVLTAEIEVSSRDDSAYGYSLRESYKFQALRDKRNELSLQIRDDSDVAREFPDDQDGEYDVRMRIRVRTKELNAE
jgi:translation initiation factor 2B subunit (eIF-2B alpha/beta/delta family)